MDEDYAEAFGQGLAKQSLDTPARISRRTRLETLQDMREAVAQKLRHIDEAIEVLQSNPAIQNVLDKLDKVKSLY